MASILNSAKDVAAGFIGQWENTQDYTSAVLTFSAPVDGSGVIEWAHTDGRRLPSNSDIVASERFTYNSSTAVTKQWDHRARWFRVRYDHVGAAPTASFSDMSFNLQTLYKRAPTELKIVDDSANIVSVNSGAQGNSLLTVLTDACGQLLRTTNGAQTSGNALYTHLADGSGVSLATTVTAANNESLFVALRDASNVGFDSTGELAANNALFVRPGDGSGNAQASTFMVKDAHSAGVALYGALADNCGFQITTTNTAGGATTGHNALYVHLADSNGQSIYNSNPLPVVNTAETVGALAYDVSFGITEDFIFPAPDMSSSNASKINLYNIFVYNESPVTVWLKVYDVSYQDVVGRQLLGPLFGTNAANTTASLNALDSNNGSAALKYNLTVQAGRARDLTLPGGATFNNGVMVRATTQFSKYSTQGPGADMVFLNGTYTLENRT